MSELDHETIDRVLRGLGQANPPDGIEQRIVARLQAQAKPKPAPVRGWAWGLALAAAMLLISLLLSKRSHAPLEAPNQAHGPVAHPLDEGDHRRVDAAPELASAASSNRPQGFHRAHSSRSSLRREQSPSPLLVSFPAPEAPLTAEEKLLIRIARNGDLQEFKPVSPPTTVREIAQNQAEFETFVHQSWPGRNP